MNTDRLPRIQRLLRLYREGAEPGMLAGETHRLEAEVEALETLVAFGSARQRSSLSAVRLALDFLRSFGRIACLSFSEVPDEDRPQLVRLLALEHRWCYAAAGTTRGAFKRAIGRTGAR